LHIDAPLQAKNDKKLSFFTLYALRGNDE